MRIYSLLGGVNTEELFSCTRDLLPFKDGQFKIVSVEGKEDCFKAELKCNLSTPELIDEFIQSYSLRNDETLRKQTPRKYGSTSKYYYVVYYRCQH